MPPAMHNFDEFSSTSYPNSFPTSEQLCFNTFTSLLLRLILQTVNRGFACNCCRHQTLRRRCPHPQSRSPWEQPRKARRPPQRTRNRRTRSQWLRPTSRRAANRTSENQRSACSSPRWKQTRCRMGTRPQRGRRSGDSPWGAS